MEFPAASSPKDLVPISFKVLSYSQRIWTWAVEGQFCSLGRAVCFPVVSVKNPKLSCSYLVSTLKDIPDQCLLPCFRKCQLILVLCLYGAYIGRAVILRPP